MLQPYRHAIEVRFRDLDGLGHINNAVYHTYVEQCRTKMFVVMGLGELKHIRGDFPIILARTEMDFLMQGSYGDQIVVECVVEKVGNKSFTQSYRVIAEGKGELARAKAVLVWFDFEKNTSVPIPDKARELLNRVVQPAS